MAKDPAVLWYYQDYLQGTEEMSWAEQGAYARLLNKQADKGHLSAEMIAGILKKDGPKLWPKIKHKFLLDENGNFYNERMEFEVQKRKAYSGKQRDRIKAYWDGVRNNRGSTTDNTTVHTNEYSTVKPIENGNVNTENKGVVRQIGIVHQMVAIFKQFFPKYPEDPDADFQACLSIAQKIGKQEGWLAYDILTNKDHDVLKIWAAVAQFASGHKWFRTRSISDLNNEWQRLMQSYSNPTDENNSAKSGSDVADQIRKARQNQTK